MLSEVECFYQSFTNHRYCIFREDNLSVSTDKQRVVAGPACEHGAVGLGHCEGSNKKMATVIEHNWEYGKRREEWLTAEQVR